MRLLHVIDSINPSRGGPPEAVRVFMQCPGSSEQGVLSLDHKTDPWIQSFPPPVFCAGPGRGKYGYTPRIRHWLRQHARNYDALIVHGCWQFHGVAVRAAARAARVPSFIFPHGMLDPEFDAESPLSRLKRFLYWPIERRNLQSAAAVFFSSEEERNRLPARFSFESAVRIVPCGMDPEMPDPEQSRAAFFERFPELREKRIILFLGSLHPKKGIDLLLRAFEGLVQPPGAHLVIAGPPTTPKYELELSRMARACGTDRVTFTGMLSGLLKAGALHAADAFILPSHQENSGSSVIEALAAGLPALVSDKVTLWREIVASGAGLVAPDTEAGARKLLADWFAKSHDEAARIRTRALECWMSRFSAGAASSRFLRTVRECAVQESGALELRSLPA